MAEVKNFAVFDADLPDDGLEDEHGNYVAPPGRNIVHAIGDHLREQGTTPTPPRQRSFYGWEFEFPVEGVTIWAVLQNVGRWLLIAEARGGLFSRPRDKHQSGVDLLDRAIRSDPRFADLRWMTRREFEEMEKHAPIAE